MAGVIRPEYWVSCGICGEERCTCASTYAAALKQMKSWGYRRTVAYGWLCGDCDLKRGNQPRREPLHVRQDEVSE